MNNNLVKNLVIFITGGYITINVNCIKTKVVVKGK